MKNNSIVPNTNIPLYIFLSETVYALLDVSPVNEYDSQNQKTDKIVGFKYTVANIETFDRLSVKVVGVKPLLSREELANRRENGEKIYVEFDNATVTMYWSNFTKSYADSFKADGISIVETAN